MGKPKFEFTSNNLGPDDDSGVAVWRYTDHRKAEIVVRQEFSSFRAAHAIDGLMLVAFNAGEAAGYERCSNNVLAAIR